MASLLFPVCGFLLKDEARQPDRRPEEFLLHLRHRCLPGELQRLWSDRTEKRFQMKKKFRKYSGVGTVGTLHSLLLLFFTVVAIPARASEFDALLISQNIQALHMPHGTVIDPMFTSPYSNEIARYTRGGDSALWTGHYLAAEAFRYRVTGSPEALANVWKALRGIRSLVDVTGTNLLARCLVPVNWETDFDKRGIVTEEAGHGIYTATLEGQPYYWVGNTSRDQYSGVFFGLGVAYDMIQDTNIGTFVRDLVSRLLDFLLQNNWAVIMPNGVVSTVFWSRPDQQLSFLQVGRRVNAD